MAVSDTPLSQPPSAQATELAGPVSTSERISSVDTLRGVALLGILLMNITGFALPFAASWNPTVAGGDTGANLWVWAVNTVAFEGKMRAIFSMLFGAGVVILTSRLDRRGLGVETADIYYRRILWLLAFGLVHAYLIWWGDILFFYAVIGLFLFPLRKASGRALVIAGLLLLFIIPVRELLEARGLEELRGRVMAAEADAAAGKELTPEQRDAQKGWEEAVMFSRPPAEVVQKETDDYRGGYLQNLGQRAGFLSGSHPHILYHFFIFDIGGMMVLGMGLYKLGFFSAARSYREYAVLAALGFVAGLPLAAVAARSVMAGGFDPIAMAYAEPLYYASRPPVAIAWVGVVMLVCKTGSLRWLTSRLAAVGQMAFTNYLFHSLVFTTLFYGYGFGLFGYLERHQLYYLVGAMWLFQLVVSRIWLQHFRFGPVEWLWRSLTWWTRQPMRFTPAARAAATGD
jgi:uncharacterized protein